jgi:tripartite-type tricarboxylate transporter receptor subunit TctC
MEEETMKAISVSGRARRVLRRAAVAGAGLGTDQDVEFIVPAGTGGGADQMARASRASSPSTA